MRRKHQGNVGACGACLKRDSMFQLVALAVCIFRVRIFCSETSFDGLVSCAAVPAQVRFLREARAAASLRHWSARTGDSGG